TLCAPSRGAVTWTAFCCPPAASDLPAGNRARLGTPVPAPLSSYLTGACSRSPGPSRRRPGRVLAAHGAAAFPPPARAHMRLAFALLLRRLAAGFLAFRFREIALVLLFAFIFRCAGFLERD